MEEYKKENRNPVPISHQKETPSRYLSMIFTLFINHMVCFQNSYYGKVDK